MMINKYNRVFFAPNDGTEQVVNPEIDTGETFTPIHTNTTVTKKKRNLVTLSTPLIIKLTPYEKEETVVGQNGQNESETTTTTTQTVTYYKTNKSFNQILDAYLMDRTIKIYQENKQINPLDEASFDISITTDIIDSIRFYKGIINNKSIYCIPLGPNQTFYSFSPDTYMTTKDLIETTDSDLNIGEFTPGDMGQNKGNQL